MFLVGDPARARRADRRSRTDRARCIPPLQLHNHRGCAWLKTARLRLPWRTSLQFAALKRSLPVPRQPWFERSSPSPKWAGGIRIHRPMTSLRRVNPVASFVCACMPGTTRKHAPAPSTALPKSHPCPPRNTRNRKGPGSARSYWRHSHQSMAFESPADKAGTGHHSGSHTPCTVSLTLHHSSHVGRTYSSGACQVCSRLPPRHSFHPAGAG